MWLLRVFGITISMLEKKQKQNNFQDFGKFISIPFIAITLYWKNENTKTEKKHHSFYFSVSCPSSCENVVFDNIGSIKPKKTMYDSSEKLESKFHFKNLLIIFIINLSKMQKNISIEIPWQICWVEDVVVTISF